MTCEGLLLYRRVPRRDEHDEHGLHRLGAEEKLFRKPTLVCCGGAHISQFEEPDIYERAVKRRFALFTPLNQIEILSR